MPSGYATARRAGASASSWAPTKAAVPSPTPYERPASPSRSSSPTKHTVPGLRRKKSAKSTLLSPDEQRVRDFTLCHDNDAMPATYRVYQTATPRVYDATKVRLDHNNDWVVRSMDDAEVFGVVLYRKSYVEAVRNRWLADYRIIAVGLNDPGAYQIANQLATATESKGRHRLTTTHFLRGLAFTLAMGGATVDQEDDSVPIKSCIAFMNTVDKSKNLAKELEQPIVRDWLQNWLNENNTGQKAAAYSLEHLDATDNVSKRETAKGADWRRPPRPNPTVSSTWGSLARAPTPRR